MLVESVTVDGVKVLYTDFTDAGKLKSPTAEQLPRWPWPAPATSAGAGGPRRDQLLDVGEEGGNQDAADARL